MQSRIHPAVRQQQTADGRGELLPKQYGELLPKRKVFQEEVTARTKDVAFSSRSRYLAGKDIPTPRRDSRARTAEGI
jgi:hypothetical protein